MVCMIRRLVDINAQKTSFTSLSSGGESHHNNDFKVDVWFEISQGL